MYSLFLSAASGPLQADVSANGFCKALKAGVDAIQKYGGAEPGDRTMVSTKLNFLKSHTIKIFITNFVFVKTLHLDVVFLVLFPSWMHCVQAMIN